MLFLDIKKPLAVWSGVFLLNRAKSLIADFKRNWHRVLHAHGSAVLLAGDEVRQLADGPQRFLIEARAQALYNFQVRHFALRVHHETGVNVAFHAVSQCQGWVAGRLLNGRHDGRRTAGR